MAGLLAPQLTPEEEAALLEQEAAAAEAQADQVAPPPADPGLGAVQTEVPQQQLQEAVAPPPAEAVPPAAEVTNAVVVDAPPGDPYQYGNPTSYDDPQQAPPPASAMEAAPVAAEPVPAPAPTLGGVQTTMPAGGGDSLAPGPPPQPGYNVLAGSAPQTTYPIAGNPGVGWQPEPPRPTVTADPLTRRFVNTPGLAASGYGNPGGYGDFTSTGGLPGAGAAQGDNTGGSGQLGRFGELAMLLGQAPFRGITPSLQNVGDWLQPVFQEAAPQTPTLDFLNQAHDRFGRVGEVVGNTWGQMGEDALNYQLTPADIIALGAGALGARGTPSGRLGGPSEFADNMIPGRTRTDVLRPATDVAPPTAGPATQLLDARGVPRVQPAAIAEEPVVRPPVRGGPTSQTLPAAPIDEVTPMWEQAATEARAAQSANWARRAEANAPIRERNLAAPQPGEAVPPPRVQPAAVAEAPVVRAPARGGPTSETLPARPASAPTPRPPADAQAASRIGQIENAYHRAGGDPAAKVQAIDSPPEGGFRAVMTNGDRFSGRPGELPAIQRAPAAQEAAPSDTVPPPKEVPAGAPVTARPAPTAQEAKTTEVVPPPKEVPEPAPVETAPVTPKPKGFVAKALTPTPKKVAGLAALGTVMAAPTIASRFGYTPTAPGANPVTAEQTPTAANPEPARPPWHPTTPEEWDRTTSDTFHLMPADEYDRKTQDDVVEFTDADGNVIVSPTRVRTLPGHGSQDGGDPIVVGVYLNGKLTPIPGDTSPEEFKRLLVEGDAASDTDKKAPAGEKVATPDEKATTTKDADETVTPPEKVTAKTPLVSGGGTNTGGGTRGSTTAPSGGSTGGTRAPYPTSNRSGGGSPPRSSGATGSGARPSGSYGTGGGGSGTVVPSFAGQPRGKGFNFDQFAAEMNLAFPGPERSIADQDLGRDFTADDFLEAAKGDKKKAAALARAANARRKGKGKKGSKVSGGLENSDIRASVMASLAEMLNR